MPNESPKSCPFCGTQVERHPPLNIIVGREHIGRIYHPAVGPCPFSRINWCGDEDEWNRRIPSVSTAELEKLEAEMRHLAKHIVAANIGAYRDTLNTFADRVALISKATNGRGK